MIRIKNKINIKIIPKTEQKIIIAPKNIQELINMANTNLSALAYNSSSFLLMLIGWVYLFSMPPKNIMLDISLSPILILIFINLLMAHGQVQMA